MPLVDDARSAFCPSVPVAVPSRSGVSVVICCHNGADRLPAALSHLAAQKTPAELAWEVILVDNASTDHTAAIATRSWVDGHAVPLRIVREPRLGLTYARQRGIAEAQFNVVSFVDDDNWLADNWVATVSQLMSENPEIGALAGLSYPACEINAPQWFQRFKNWYAIVTEADLDHSSDTLSLVGAGLTLRKSAWEQLVRGGFRPKLSDRQGTKLFAGGDSEITLALRLAGWKLHADPRLRLEHHLPERRLNWQYLRRVVRGYYSSSVALDAYLFVDHPRSGLRNRLRQWWLWHAASAVKSAVRKPRKLLLSLCTSMEGDGDALEIERDLGRIIGLFRLRGSYGAIRREIQSVEWRSPLIPRKN